MSPNGRTVGMVYPPAGHLVPGDKGTEYGHPTHRGFARAVDATDIVMASVTPEALGGTIIADTVSTVASTFPERDLYVIENDSALYATPRLRYRYPESTIVHLAASHRLFGHLDVPHETPRSTESRLQAAERRINELADRTLLQRLFKRYTDGAIAVSEVAARRLQVVVGSDLPVRVVNPYIEPEKFERLAGVDPDLSANVAVTISQWRAHKGIDMLVSAWPEVRERHPDAKLRIVGPGHPGHYGETEGVEFCGFVENLEAELAGASLYVHPAYIEPFGVSVVEGMRAGLPAVVTDTTGARSAVRPVDESLVVEPDPSALAESVSRYFALPVERRRALSEASHEQSASFSKENQTRRFRRQLRALVRDIRDREETTDATTIPR